MPARAGMVFNINVGLADLKNEAAEDAAGRTYSLLVGDIVQVGQVRGKEMRGWRGGGINNEVILKSTKVQTLGRIWRKYGLKTPFHA